MSSQYVFPEQQQNSCNFCQETLGSSSKPFVSLSCCSFFSHVECIKAEFEKQYKYKCGYCHKSSLTPLHNEEEEEEGYYFKDAEFYRAKLYIQNPENVMDRCSTIKILLDTIQILSSTQSYYMSSMQTQGCYKQFPKEFTGLKYRIQCIMNKVWKASGDEINQNLMEAKQAKNTTVDFCEKVKIEKSQSHSWELINQQGIESYLKRGFEELFDKDEKQASSSTTKKEEKKKLSTFESKNVLLGKRKLSAMASEKEEPKGDLFKRPFTASPATPPLTYHKETIELVQFTDESFFSDISSMSGSNDMMDSSSSPSFSLNSDVTNNTNLFGNISNTQKLGYTLDYSLAKENFFGAYDASFTAHKQLKQ